MDSSFEYCKPAKYGELDLSCRTCEIGVEVNGLNEGENKHCESNPLEFSGCRKLKLSESSGLPLEPHSMAGKRPNGWIED